MKRHKLKSNIPWANAEPMAERMNKAAESMRVLFLPNMSDSQMPQSGPKQPPRVALLVTAPPKGRKNPFRFQKDNRSRNQRQIVAEEKAANRGDQRDHVEISDAPQPAGRRGLHRRRGAARKTGRRFRNRLRRDSAGSKACWLFGSAMGWRCRLKSDRLTRDGAACSLRSKATKPKRSFGTKRRAQIGSRSLKHLPLRSLSPS